MAYFPSEATSCLYKQPTGKEIEDEIKEILNMRTGEKYFFSKENNFKNKKEFDYLPTKNLEKSLQ